MQLVQEAAGLPAGSSAWHRQEAGKHWGEMGMEQEVLLKIDHVVKTYPGVQALKGISTTIRKGEVRALVGENGAGKSTLIKCIMGVEAPTGGKWRSMWMGTGNAPEAPSMQKTWACMQIISM